MLIRAGMYTHCIHYTELRDTENICIFNEWPKWHLVWCNTVGKEIKLASHLCMRVKVSLYEDLSQNLGSLGGWVISILTLQMI